MVGSVVVSIVVESIRAWERKISGALSSAGVFAGGWKGTVVVARVTVGVKSTVSVTDGNKLVVPTVTSTVSVNEATLE